jgi:hypothetical protein
MTERPDPRDTSESGPWGGNPTDIENAAADTDAYGDLLGEQQPVDPEARAALEDSAAPDG